MKRLNPRRHAWAALALLAMFGGEGALAQQSAGRGVAEPVRPDVRYVVKPGDNLFRLASNYLIRPEDYRVVQKLNRVADPLRLPVGVVLVIPRELLKHEPVRGTVHSYRGAVRIGGKPAALGMAVGEGMLIETGQKSFVTLILPDETSIALPSQSSVRVQRLRRVVLDSHVERLFGIERGGASASVTPMTDPNSDFRFSTPGAITSVRGTKFRMGYDSDADLATSEVLEGKVGFDASDNGHQTLPAGFGSNSKLAEPVALLTPPEIVAPDAVQKNEGLRFVLKPLPGARAYHVQIGADAKFLGVLDETTSSSPEASFASLPDGSYFVRATGIDGNELEGEPAVYPFARQLKRLRMAVEMGWAGQARQYLFSWDVADAANAEYRFQLVKAGRKADANAKPFLEVQQLHTTSQAVVAIPKGTYRWRFMTTRTVDGKVTSEWSPYSELTVESPW